jgi:hypothetical protein
MCVLKKEESDFISGSISVLSFIHSDKGQETQEWQKGKSKSSSPLLSQA